MIVRVILLLNHLLLLKYFTIPNITCRFFIFTTNKDIHNACGLRKSDIKLTMRKYIVMKVHSKYHNCSYAMTINCNDNVIAKAN